MDWDHTIGLNTDTIYRSDCTKPVKSVVMRWQYRVSLSIRFCNLVLELFRCIVFELLTINATFTEDTKG
jgi:hypothetical protein